MLSKIFSTSIIIILILLNSCSNSERPFKKISSSAKYHYGDTLPVSESVGFELNVNGEAAEADSYIIVDRKMFNIGVNNLEFTAEGENKKITRKVVVYPIEAPVDLDYRIIKEYHHNPDVFTQGLELFSGKIYESGGQYKKSKLFRYSLDMPNKKLEYSFDDDVFAEGLTVLGNNLYVLSWREHLIFKFNPENLELINRKKTPIDFEGWGLTNNGKHLIISDGSNSLFFLNPDDYSISKILQVYNNRGKLKYLNELEHVDDLILANSLDNSVVYGIDVNSGENLYEIDFKKLADIHKRQGVLNGIARLKNGNFLITGKNWDKMYEVEIDF
ncbi:MAG: glutaminyl-peptide cyclotransferase [Bacteroidota bacterium]